MLKQKLVILAILAVFLGLALLVFHPPLEEHLAGEWICKKVENGGTTTLVLRFHEDDQRFDLGGTIDKQDREPKSNSVPDIGKYRVTDRSKRRIYLAVDAFLSERGTYATIHGNSFEIDLSKIGPAYLAAGGTQDCIFYKR